MLNKRKSLSVNISLYSFSVVFSLVEAVFSVFEGMDHWRLSSQDALKTTETLKSGFPLSRPWGSATRTLLHNHWPQDNCLHNKLCLHISECWTNSLFGCHAQLSLTDGVHVGVSIIGWCLTLHL